MTTNQGILDVIARNIYGCVATLFSNHWELSVAVTGSFLLVSGLFGYISLSEHLLFIWFIATIVYFCGIRRWYVFCLRQGNYIITDWPILLGITILYGYSAVSLFIAWYSGNAMSSELYLSISTWLMTFMLFFDYVRAYLSMHSLYALQKLMGTQPSIATVWRDNGWRQVLIKHVSVGDRLQVIAGEIIPADGVIISGASSVNEQVVTGKVTMVFKDVDDQVFAGTINLSGSFEMRAEKVGEYTLLAKIIELLKQADLLAIVVADRFKKYTLIFVLAVIILAIVTFFIWFIGGLVPQFMDALITACSVLMIAAVSAPFLALIMVLVAGIGRMMQVGIMVKYVKIFDLVRCTQVIVFDKTGTLTYGKYKVQEFELVHDIEEIFTSLQWSIPSHVSAPSYAKAIIRAVEALSDHAVASAVADYLSEYKLLMKLVLNEQEIEQFETVPGLGVRCVFHGHRVLIGSRKYMEQEQISVALAVDGGSEIWAAAANTVSFVAFDNQLVAYFCVADAVREEASNVIAQLKARKIKTILITGDDQSTADAIAQRVGIEHVLARIMPQEKAAQVRALQSNGSVVAMVGDGIQDVLALAAADVGIAFCNGIGNASGTVDVALLQEDMMLIPKIITYSQEIMSTVYQNVVMSIVYNVIAIPLAMGVWYLLFGSILSPLYAGVVMIGFSVLLMLHALRMRI